MKDFIMTENDIADLDMFFVFNTNGNIVKTAREPIMYFSASGSSNTTPIFQLGSQSFVAVGSGVELYAGKIIMHAFQNIPMMNVIKTANVPSFRLSSLPLMDLYILNKRKYEKSQRLDEQDMIIKNIKFLDINFEQGMDTPGRFYVLNYIAQSIDTGTINEGDPIFKDNLEFRNTEDTNFDIGKYFANTYLNKIRGVE